MCSDYHFGLALMLFSPGYRRTHTLQFATLPLADRPEDFVILIFEVNWPHYSIERTFLDVRCNRFSIRGTDSFDCLLKIWNVAYTMPLAQ